MSRGALRAAAALPLIACLAGCAPAREEAAPSPPPGAGSTAAADDTLLVGKLLRLRDPAFAREGGYDALGELKAWEALYGRTLARAGAEPEGSDEALRRYLLIAFVARARAEAGISESLSTDLLPLYRKRRDPFLRILRELPYLAPAACHYLGAWFTFEERDRAGMAPFLEENRPLIEQALGPAAAPLCLESLASAGGVAPAR